jgi:hypothetical protein
MAAKEPFQIPVGMQRVCRRFERWRKRHRGPACRFQRRYGGQPADCEACRRQCDSKATTCDGVGLRRRRSPPNDASGKESRPREAVRKGRTS